MLRKIWGFLNSPLFDAVGGFIGMLLFGFLFGSRSPDYEDFVCFVLGLFLCMSVDSWHHGIDGIYKRIKQDRDQQHR